MFTVDDLDVYNLSHEFSDRIWKLVLSRDSFAKFGLGRQLTDAADPISSNIAEGYGRYFMKDNIRFCFYSRGSILETKNWLRKAKNRNLLEDSIHNELVNDLKIIHKKLKGISKFSGKIQI